MNRRERQSGSAVCQDGRGIEPPLHRVGCRAFILVGADLGARFQLNQLLAQHLPGLLQKVAIQIQAQAWCRAQSKKHLMAIFVKSDLHYYMNH